MSEGHIYIDGRWAPAASGATREVINPHDASVVATMSEGDRQDAKRAVAAAREAFDASPWPRMSRADRCDLVASLAAAVRQDRDELCRLETLDTGKTLAESGWDMDDVAAVFDYYARLGLQWPASEPLPSPNAGSESVLVQEPVGVCGQISPWNYPLLQASWKLAPAMVAGCTVVIKPSELTPLSTVRLVELVHDLGIPPGVINLVPGAGPTVGAELAESHDVDLISFTGGVQTGQGIMRAAAGNLKRVALELGGKNPHIIFGDADLEVALDHSLNGVLFHAGQICSAGARLLVQDDICDRFTAALGELMAAVPLGSGMSPETRMGPLISGEHRQKVAAFVDGAVEQGARLVCGGRAPGDPALARGFYYQPTLLDGCTAEMDVVQQEVFGPVITVERFSSEDEAVALANDTDYGLSAGLHTTDPIRGNRVAAALRFGTVWINDFNIYFPAAPWGGFKRSGIGRELGRAGLEEYTELKHIYRQKEPAPLGWFTG